MCFGERLPFSCDHATILATFSTIPSITALSDEIGFYEKLRFKMNDCGKVSDSHYRIHWYREDDGVDVRYEVTDINVSSP
jgi:hypothetical protein